MRLICIEKNNYSNTGKYQGYFLLTVGKLYDCELSPTYGEYLVFNDMGFSFSYPMKLFNNNKEYRRLKLLELRNKLEL